MYVCMYVCMYVLYVLHACMDVGTVCACVQHVRLVIWMVHVFCVCCMYVYSMHVVCNVCAAFEFCSVDVCSVPHVQYVLWIGFQYTPWQQMLWHGAKIGWVGRHGPQCLGSKPPGDERGSKPHSEAVRRRSPCLAGALGSKP